VENAVVDQSPETVRRLIAEALHPADFFVAPPQSLAWHDTADERLPWEIYRGRLLDRSQTTETRCFAAWNVFGIGAEGRTGEPLLSVLWDREAGQVHVTRAIHCYSWEGYHAGNNVYLSREVARWVRELVGTIDWADVRDPQELQEEITGLLFHAVVGLSRLPLTSVEAPLPGFSLGELGYFDRSRTGVAEARLGPMNSCRDLLAYALRGDLGWLEKVRLVELVVRCTPKESIGGAADLFERRWREIGHSAAQIGPLFRALFDEVALSPYTDFVDKTLAFLHHLVERGSLGLEEQVDFLGYLLRHLGRHLTAYDLITFHHRGANYPDALLLDAVLKDYLSLLERHPGLFAAGADGDERPKRLRRRALRQGWMLRRRYEGLPVPDLPTSPGENARLLPPPHRRVPEEQILDPEKRTRHLYADDPLTLHLGEHGRQVLWQSIEDLRHPLELRELGMALFLDRPLSLDKAPGQPDLTPLLSYEAFSRSIAEQRLRFLAGLPELAAARQGMATALKTLPGLRVDGVPLGRHRGVPRPGAVSVEDAHAVADDFVFLRTTGRSVADFLALFDFTALGQRFTLDYMAPGQRVLILRGRAAEIQEDGVLVIYDAALRRRLELQVDPHAVYAIRGGSEFPVAGLRVRAVWEPVTEREERFTNEVRLATLRRSVRPPGNP
jgi:hypothetical protein